jgi:hypothetical protein
VLLVSSLALPSLAAWKSLLNSAVAGLTARSLHHVINLSLSSFWTVDPQVRQSILLKITQTSYVGFCAYYAWVLLKPYFQPTYSEEHLIVDIGWTTFVLFLLATPWLMPWYSSVLWAIALLSINTPGFLLVSLAFCLSPGIIYGTGSGLGAISMLTALLTLAPPIAMMLLLEQPFIRPWRDRLQSSIGRVER